MIKYLAAATTALLVAGGATAQTSADKAWAGPYVGVHVGYGFDSDRYVSDTGATANNLVALGTGVRPQRIQVNRNGMVAGGQAGFNMQSGRIVYGVEGDFSWSDQEGGETVRSQFASPAAGAAALRRTYVRSDLDWLGSARARIGYALSDNGMVYATGGYTFGQIKGRAEFNGATDDVVNYAGRHKYVAQGWTAGVGAEFKPWSGDGMLSKVSVKLEGSYYDLGKSRIFALQTNTQPGFYTLGFDTRGYNARVGMNYHF